jgi:hypothetical protein
MEKTVSHYLNSIKEEFETWREQRKGKEKIPKRLWELAIKLTEAYPISFVSHELKIDYSQLKYRSRVSATKQSSSISTQPQESLSSEQKFYEVTPNQLLASITDPAIFPNDITNSFINNLISFQFRSQLRLYYLLFVLFL